MKPLTNSTLATPACAALARASSSISSVMSRPIALPVGPTRRALIRTSAPAPDPRSSTVSPSCRSATAVGTPQPSDAATAVAVAPSASASSYSAAPNTCALSASVSAIGPQHDAEPCCSATALAAAAYFSRTVSRMSSDPLVASRSSPAEQPQPPPAAASGPQQASFVGWLAAACLRLWGAAARGRGRIGSQLSHAVSSSRASVETE